MRMKELWIDRQTVIDVTCHECRIDTSQHRQENDVELKTEKSAAFWNGYEAMKEKISAIGWEPARNEFNIAVPPGKLWTGSKEGLEYAHGEFQALFETDPA